MFPDARHEHLRRLHRADHKAVEALDLKDSDGASPDLSRIAVEPPRDATHGDLATNAAMVLAKPTGQNPRALAERLAAALRADPDVARGRGGRPRLRQPEARRRLLAARSSPRSSARAATTAARRSAAAGRSMSNTSRPTRPARCMSAIAAAPWSATRSPTCSPSPATTSPRNTTSTTPARRSTCSAARLMLRYREALGEDDRRDPGRPLSRRLSRAGRAGAGRGVWPQPAADAGGRGAGDRQGSHHRRHDGDDPRRSRAAQRASRRVLLGALAARRQWPRRSARRSTT